MTEIPESPDVLVSLVGVHKHYEMGDETVRALDGVDIQIHEGELVAIMGQSGSGKSTLMNVLGCLDTPTQGQYTLAGTVIKALSAERLARIRNEHIGFVFQSFHLLPRQSALENVTLPLVYRRFEKLSAKERKAKAEESLTLVGLGDRTLHKPNEMSGGQRQRVAIARALVGEPSILLADEPTGNLDSATGEEILQLLTTLQKEKKKTVIIVTHEAEVGERCDRVITLRDGRVTSDICKEGTLSAKMKALSSKPVAANEEPASEAPESEARHV